MLVVRKYSEALCKRPGTDSEEMRAKRMCTVTRKHQLGGDWWVCIIYSKSDNPTLVVPHLCSFATEDESFDCPLALASISAVSWSPTRIKQPTHFHRLPQAAIHINFTTVDVKLSLLKRTPQPLCLRLKFSYLPYDKFCPAKPCPAPQEVKSIIPIPPPTLA